MLLEAIARVVTDGQLSAVPFNIVAALLGAAVGYGMVKGKVDSTETSIVKMEERFEKRFDRIEKTLDQMQLEMRQGAR